VADLDEQRLVAEAAWKTEQVSIGIAWKFGLPLKWNGNGDDFAMICDDFCVVLAMPSAQSPQPRSAKVVLRSSDS
jgi:hypothetical protein